MYRVKKIFSILIFLSILFYMGAVPSLRISMSLIIFPDIEQGLPVEGTFNIKNSGSDELKVSLATSCDCLHVDRAYLTIAQDEVVVIHYSFETTLYSGYTNNDIILTTNDPEIPVYFIPFQGNVLVDGTSPINEENSTFNNHKGDIPLHLYGYVNCKTCKPLLEQINSWIDNQEESYSLTIHNLETQDGKEQLARLVEQIGFMPKTLPVLVDGENVYGGENEITAFLKSEIINPEKSLLDLGLIGIILAGLIDGINPCAFTVIILLISYLLLQVKSRKQIIIIGSLYVLTVFITYFLIGLGLFEIVRRISFFPLIKETLRWVISGALVVLAGVSLYDFIRAVQGRNNDMLLKLPGYLQKVVRSTIRQEMKHFVIIASSIFLGFIVSLTELVCTGQVYIPVLAYMARTDMNLSNFGQLVIYNVSFIIPLVIIFIMVLFGVSSKKIGDFFSRHVAFVKMLFIVLFVSFAFINFFVK